jgi:hypothetical protein
MLGDFETQDLFASPFTKGQYPPENIDQIALQIVFVPVIASLPMNTQKTYSFRPPPEIEAELVKALGATNATVTDLLTRCVQRSLPDVVRELHEDRSRQAASYLKEHASDGGWKSKR